MLNNEQRKAKLKLIGTTEEYGFSDAHNAWFYCAHHRDELKEDLVCGCFYCLKIFHPSEITEWCDGGETAQCPYCYVDSIIGESSGYPITLEFLQEMHKPWFTNSRQGAENRAD